MHKCSCHKVLVVSGVWALHKVHCSIMSCPLGRLFFAEKYKHLDNWQSCFTRNLCMTIHIAKHFKYLIIDSLSITHSTKLQMCTSTRVQLMIFASFYTRDFGFGFSVRQRIKKGTWINITYISAFGENYEVDCINIMVLGLTTHMWYYSSPLQSHRFINVDRFHVKCSSVAQLQNS